MSDKVFPEKSLASKESEKRDSAEMLESIHSEIHQSSEKFEEDKEETK